MIKMKHADIVCSLVLLVFCAAAWMGTLNFTESAALLPRITIGLIALLSVAQIIRTLVKAPEKTISFALNRTIPLVLCTLAYAVLMMVVGYYVATFLYIAVVMYTYGVRNKAVLLAVPIGFCIFSAICFVQFLSLRLPQPFFL